MEIDRQKIARIAAMPDKDFAALVYQVVRSAGADESQARMAMSIAPMLKERLRSADAAELERVMKTMGEEKVRGILNSLDA